MSVHLIVSFVVRQQRLASFRTLLDGVKRDLPKVPGCVAVRVFNQSDRQHIFVVVEHWQSQEHHRAHLEHLVHSGGWEHISSHLEAAPVSTYYTEV